MNRTLAIFFYIALSFRFLAIAEAQQTSWQSSTGNSVCDYFFKKLSQSSALTMDSFLQDLRQSSNFEKAIQAKSLMYHSRAMHGTTLQNPRALIMYGNSDLVLAFNGEKDQAFYNVLEIMCYNRAAGEFQFRAIQFNGDVQSNSLPVEDVEGELNNFQITKSNPKACMQCHSTAGSGFVRPSWSTYLAWAGSYGSYEEAYNIPSARFALENTEYPSLKNFMSLAPQKERYRNFNWGRGSPNLQTVNNAMFGILINHKMANPALLQALNFLKKPEKQKFKYAFLGYLLQCNNEKFIPKDTPGDLGQLRSSFATERARFEIRERNALNGDLENHALTDLGKKDTVNWLDRFDGADPINKSEVPGFKEAQPGLRSMVARVSRQTSETLNRLVRFEYLYNKMGLSTEAIHLGDTITPNSKTSWDGYNEIQDYMSDYIFRYFGLPPLTPVQQKMGEETAAEQAGLPVVHRTDLLTTLSSEDFQLVEPSLNALGVEKLKGLPQAEICKELEIMSRSEFTGK